jgi:hypothetical protein
MVHQIYFIVHQEREPDRYDALIKSIKYLNLQNYKIMAPCWSTDITPELRKERAYSFRAMNLHGRPHQYGAPELSSGEISLFLNYLACLEDIRANFTDGTFIIFESDALFTHDFNASLARVMEIAQGVNWGTINIGQGEGNVPPNVQPGLNLYRSWGNKCAEGIIWNYKSVCKFLDYCTVLDGPIDCKIDVFSQYDGGPPIYWAHPPLVMQGSIHKVFKSHLR